MVACARCREAARIAREVAFIAEDLGTLYGIATGRGSTGVTVSTAAGRPLLRSKASRTVTSKGKRKVTAYQRAFGLELKKLKRKHPRTPITRLMKRAHTATKRSRK